MFVFWHTWSVTFLMSAFVTSKYQESKWKMENFIINSAYCVMSIFMLVAVFYLYWQPISYSHIVPIFNPVTDPNNCLVHYPCRCAIWPAWPPHWKGRQLTLCALFSTEAVTYKQQGDRKVVTMGTITQKQFTSRKGQNSIVELFWTVKLYE